MGVTVLSDSLEESVESTSPEWLGTPQLLHLPPLLKIIVDSDEVFSLFGIKITADTAPQRQELVAAVLKREAGHLASSPISSSWHTPLAR